MDLLDKSSEDASRRAAAARDRILILVVTIMTCYMSILAVLTTSNPPAEVWFALYAIMTVFAYAIFIIAHTDRIVSRSIQVEFLVAAAMRDYIAENIDGDIYWFERNHRLELSEILSTETDLSYDEIRRGIRAAAVRLNARMLLRSP